MRKRNILQRKVKRGDEEKEEEGRERRCVKREMEEKQMEMLSILCCERVWSFLLFCFEMRSQHIYQDCDYQVDSTRPGLSIFFFFCNSCLAVVYAGHLGKDTHN